MVKDGSETDVDCGGSCGATCDNGKACAAATDCVTAQCADGPAGVPEGARVRLLGPDGRLVAVGEAGAGGVLHPAVVLV